jgi:hypothetical protein
MRVRLEDVAVRESEQADATVSDHERTGAIRGDRRSRGVLHARNEPNVALHGDDADATVLPRDERRAVVREGRVPRRGVRRHPANDLAGRGVRDQKVAVLRYRDQSLVMSAGIEQTLARFHHASHPGAEKRVPQRPLRVLVGYEIGCVGREKEAQLGVSRELGVRGRLQLVRTGV